MISDRLVQTLQSFGFEYIACASQVDPLKPRAGAVSILNYPLAWLQHYSECGFARIDPVFLAARMLLAPFLWRDYLDKMVLNRAQKGVLAEGASYGVVNGMTIPLRSPDVIPASCSLVAGPQGVDPLLMPATLMVVIYGYGAVHRRLNPDQKIDPILLPERERECLSLVGVGKSDWVIGEVLGISERTAHNYVERAKKRYGVSSRIQAVVRAVFDAQIIVDELSE